MAEQEAVRHFLPAAAIPEGATVLLEWVEGEEPEELVIDHVENSTPRAGKITWYRKDGTNVVMSATLRVEVLKFEHEE